MSIYGALFAGVSGLEAQSNTLSVISNNIANVNTVGFKGAEGLFSSLVTSSAGAAFAPGGVLGTAQQLVDVQGQLQTTSSPTDIAISGTGFFVVNQDANGNGQVLYTRAGGFTQDSTGNFVNASGFYLQAWPLNHNGLLPGQPGNLDTTSDANLSSLETVNVENVTGSASPTTNVSIGANLESTQTPLAGSGVTAGMDTNDSVNADNTADDFIVPTGLNTDSLHNGDSFKITTGSGSVDQTYTYGGYTVSRNATSGTAATVAAGGNNAAVPGATGTITAPAFTYVSTGTGTTTFQVTQANTLADGASVVIGGTVPNTEDIDGIPAADFNGTFVVSNANSTTYDIVVPVVAASRSLSIATDGSTSTVTVTDTGSNLQSGDKVTISGVSSSGIGGISQANLQGTFTVTRVNANSYTYTAGGSSSSGTSGAGTGLTTTAGHPASGTIDTNSRIFTGKILNASSSSDLFLNGLSSSNFTSSALTFTITTPDTGTVTYTYTAGTPSAQLGQFNTLDNLATAISDTNGLTARVYNNQIYISAINANDQISFANGSATGIQGPPSQSGIDWVSELGIQSTVAAGTNRFSTLQGLANVVNGTGTTGLTATVNDAEGDSSVTMDVNDPLDTITFTDTPVGSGNTGSPLAALGITTSLDGIAPTTGAASVKGPLGPAYSPIDTTENMASGSTTPQFSRPVQVYDALGTAHNLNIGFVNTGTNSWAVEVYAQPASDVSNGNTISGGALDGQVAYGTITFNGDGSLASVSSNLTKAIPIDWTDGSIASNITIDWGTAGQPTGTAHATSIGETNGLSQFSSDYHVNFVNQNGAPVGQLTGVSIGSTGIITASYSNGETQNLYQIPLAEFADPDQLNALTGNAYSQSEGSGQVNLVQSGTSGSGSISSSSLEASNVELANELTTMIVAQRSYEANTKVISTADTLLQDLDQIIQ